MLIARMIHYQIENQLHLALLHALEQPIEIGHRAELHHHLAIVANVVPVIRIRRIIMRTQPNHIGPNALDVIQLRRYARQIPNAISIRIFERSRIHLIHHRFFPPLRLIAIRRLSLRYARRRHRHPAYNHIKKHRAKTHIRRRDYIERKVLASTKTMQQQAILLVAFVLTAAAQTPRDDVAEIRAARTRSNQALAQHNTKVFAETLAPDFASYAATVCSCPLVQLGSTTSPPNSRTPTPSPTNAPPKKSRPPT